MALVAGGFVAAECAIRSAELPRIGAAPATPVLLDLRGRPVAVLPNALARECHPVALSGMGPWLPWATVGIEDHRFWEHAGVDWRATAGATLRNLRNGRVISGASTITQQLIKITSGRTERTMRAKSREALAALKLERSWPKEQILEAYLNRIDYGNRRLGAEAAARAYFGKPAAALSLPEAIFLAGLPQSPRRLNPWSHPEAALARYQANVERLAALGLLPEGVTEAFLRDHPPRVERHDPPAAAPQFAALVAARLKFPPREAAKITVSLDLDLQKLAEQALQKHLATVGAFGVGDAAVVIIDNATGEIRALACGGGREHAAINSAIEPRSCGSTLKPFLYLLALERRQLTAATLLPDIPEAITEEYRDYDPQNYSHRYHGPVRMREALGNSMNVPAVVTLSRLGARETFDYIRGWGLDFPQGFDAYGAGFILGNAPVRLTELAAAFAGLARGGVVWEPKVTPLDPVESRRMAGAETVAIVTDILADNDARRLSFGANSPLALPWRTGVKTGTSSNFRDGWCVGFNRDHTVAVWAGNLDGHSMGELLAVRSAAPLWAALMKALYANGDQPLPEPRESANLRRLAVAAETGLLPRPGEPAVSEWFLPGTEPVRNAAEMYAGGVLQLPKEYTQWCAGPQNRLGAQVPPGDLRILFPKNGAVFALNPTLPAGQQTLPLQSSWPDCEWFLNGQRLAKPNVPLTRGEWTLTASARGETASAQFTVE